MIHAQLMYESPTAQRMTPKYLLLFEETRAQRRKTDYRYETRNVQNVLGKYFSRRLQGSKTSQDLVRRTLELADKRWNTFQLDQLKST